MKRKINFVVLLFLTLFLFAPSTVKAPLEGATGAQVKVPLTTNACDAIIQLFMEADLSRCMKKKIVDGASLSPFQDEASECKLFCAPDEELIVKLDELKMASTPDGKKIEKLGEGKIALNTFDRYLVYEEEEFKVVFLYKEVGKHVPAKFVGVKFYCSNRRLEDCPAMMHEKVGKTGSLKSCSKNWKGWEIAKIDPMIVLTYFGWPRSVLIDPEFTIEAMPNMERSKPWTAAAIEHNNGQFHIETTDGYPIVTEKVRGLFIPYQYLDVVAYAYRKMNFYGNLHYVPRSCFPLIRLFRGADIRPHLKLDGPFYNPFKEFPYFFVPRPSFFENEHDLDVFRDIRDAEMDPNKDPLVLTLTFQPHDGNLAIADFYCAQTKKEECQELFMQVLAIKHLRKGGFEGCRDADDPWTLRARYGTIHFFKPLKGLGGVIKRSQDCLLLDPFWTEEKLDFFMLRGLNYPKIPEAYVCIAVYAYQRALRSIGDPRDREQMQSYFAHLD